MADSGCRTLEAILPTQPFQGVHSLEDLPQVLVSEYHNGVFLEVESKSSHKDHQGIGDLVDPRVSGLYIS